LWYVLDGIGRLTLAGRTCDLASGTGVVFAPGDEPVAGHDPRCRLLIFGMHFQVYRADGGRPEPVDVVPPGGWCRVRDPALVSALARRCEAGYRRGDPVGMRQSQLSLEQILYLLWEDATEPAPGPVDAALNEITQAIRQDPSRRWTVAELAAQAALSRAQFTRRFTAHAGLSPVRYLIQARIDRAQHLLAETNMSVTQVAATLGYPTSPTSAASTSGTPGIPHGAPADPSRLRQSAHVLVIRPPAGSRPRCWWRRRDHAGRTPARADA
jgi:AraC family transcriptional regulator of arabinose operon